MNTCPKINASIFVSFFSSSNYSCSCTMVVRAGTLHLYLSTTNATFRFEHIVHGNHNDRKNNNNNNRETTLNSCSFSSDQDGFSPPINSVSKNNDRSTALVTLINWRATISTKMHSSTVSQDYSFNYFRPIASILPICKSSMPKYLISLSDKHQPCMS